MKSIINAVFKDQTQTRYQIKHKDIPNWLWKITYINANNKLPYRQLLYIISSS